MRLAAALVLAVQLAVPASALSDPAQASRAYSMLQNFVQTDAEFGRLFDAGIRPKSSPFVIDMPAAVPAPFQRTVNRLLTRPQRNDYDALIRSYAVGKNLDPRLVKSVIAAESEFTAHAKSPSGALGLMQLMPETAATMGVAGRAALFNPESNIHAGTAYLAYLFDRAWKRYHLQGVAFTQAPNWLIQRIIAAYNAGPRFLTHRRLCRETREYVRKVLMFYRSSVTELKAEMTPFTR